MPVASATGRPPPAAARHQRWRGQPSPHPSQQLPGDTAKIGTSTKLATCGVPPPPPVATRRQRRRQQPPTPTLPPAAPAATAVGAGHPHPNAKSSKLPLPAASAAPRSASSRPGTSPQAACRQRSKPAPHPSPAPAGAAADVRGERRSPTNQQSLGDGTDATRNRSAAAFSGPPPQRAAPSTDPANGSSRPHPMQVAVAAANAGGA